ncbi:MAG: deoxyribose-phosphate aldolase [Anaerolineales bacterium]|nr:deoxyribose-phosphate aldolase [Anaerolineales bacterium]
MIALSRAYARELPPLPELPAEPVGAEIAAWIDHTLLKPEATVFQVKELCQQAAQYEFASVCINPVFVPLAAGLLADSPVEICTVVGFPLGANISTVKVTETLAAINSGATEIDMVLHIGALKAEAYGQVLNDIELVVHAAHNQHASVKVILENALLTDEEKIMACLLCKQAGADFVKTSTGFAASGATLADVSLMRRVVGADIGVKAAGGIRNYAGALAMIRAGADRLGASAGVQIVQEAQA